MVEAQEVPAFRIAVLAAPAIEKPRIGSDAELEIYHTYLASRVRSQSGDSTGIGLERTKQRHALYARAEVLSTRDVLAIVI